MNFYDDTGESARSSRTRIFEPSLDMGKRGGGSSSITGYTRHGINRAIGDGGNRAGTCPREILNTVKNPTNSTVQPDGSIRLQGENAIVVIRPDGRIITTIPTTSGGVRGGNSK